MKTSKAIDIAFPASLRIICLYYLFPVEPKSISSYKAELETIRKRHSTGNIAAEVDQY